MDGLRRQQQERSFQKCCKMPQNVEMGVVLDREARAFKKALREPKKAIKRVLVNHLKHPGRSLQIIKKLL